MKIGNRERSNGRGNRRALATAAVMAMMAATAPVSQAWDAPIYLSGASTSSYAPSLVMDGKGRAVAAWQQSDGVTYRVTAAIRPKGEPFSPFAMISPADSTTFALSVVANKKGNVSAVWDTYDGSIYRATVADLAPKATSFGAPVTISPDGEDIEFTRAALDKKGNAVALWTVFSGGNRLETASRPAGGTFGTPSILQNGGASDHSVIFDKKGNALAVWRESGPVFSSLRPKGGAFGLAEDVSGPGTNAFYSTSAFDNKGNALVVWDGDTGLDAAERPAGSTFGLPFQISATNPNGGAKMAFDKKGNLFVAWTRSVGLIEFHAVYATRSADGVWSVENDLAAPTVDSFVGDVAMDAKGNVRVIWTEYDEGTMTSDVATAYRPAGGAFEPSEDLAQAIPISIDTSPRIEMDKKGNAVAVWAQADAGFGRIAASFEAAP